MTWDKYNLTSNLDSPIQISIYGYKEETIVPKLQYIDTIEVKNNLY